MKKTTKRHLKGYAYLFLTIVLYALGPFMIKETYNNEGSKFENSFFIAYFCTSCYVIYLLPFFVRWTFCRESQASEKVEAVSDVNKLSNKEILRISVILGIISVAHSYILNLALRYTSVASNFILHDTSDVFVFIFCMVFLNWGFSWMRFGAVLVSVIGVLFISYSDSSDSTQKAPLTGDMLSLLSTVLYALLLTLTKLYIKNEDAMDWNKFFYYTGISTAILWFPFLIFLHITGIERITMPSGTAFGLLLMNAVLGYVFPDYTMSVSTVILDPLIVDLGLGAISPLSMILDYYYENKTFDALYLFGYGFILLAFVLIVLYDFLYEVDHNEKELKEDDEERGKELDVLIDQ